MKKLINAEIEKWYGRLASNNEVSLEGAHKLLSDNELKEFKWTVSDYIKHGRNNIDGRFAKELENASAKFHISRLESIKLQTRMSIESLLSDVQSDTESFLAEIYRDSYYRTAFEVQKGT